MDLELQLEKIVNAETGIINSMADLFTDFKKNVITPKEGAPETNGAEYADELKQILCALACKELSIANIIEAVACKIAVANGTIQSEVCCKCCC